MFGINKYIFKPESANIWLTGTFCLSKEQKTLQKLGQKPPNGAKGPQNLSARAWLYITTCHNTQVLFKQQNLIKADGPYSIIYYYEELLWRKSSVLSPSDYFRKKNLRKIFSIGAVRTWVDSLVLLLIIEVKINFSLGFDNTDYQTNKLQNVHALHCTIVLYIVP